MWLLRQQQYPLPPLISYKIPRIRVLCRVSGQFSDWHLTGCAHRFLGVIVGTSNGTQPFTTSSLLPMSTIQVLINGNTVQGELQHIAQILGMVSNTVTTPVTNTQEETVNETVTNSLEQFDDFVVSILKDYFSETTSQHIVSKLSEIANKSYSDFTHARGLYFDFVRTLEQRNIMKVIFASYKLKSRGYISNSYRYVCISKIKYASACPHCGADAAAIRDRLVKEGYLTV